MLTILVNISSSAEKIKTKRGICHYVPAMSINIPQR